MSKLCLCLSREGLLVCREHDAGGGQASGAEHSNYRLGFRTKEMRELGGLQTFAASAKSKGQREESGRSGYHSVFCVVQTRRTAGLSPF